MWGIVITFCVHRLHLLTFNNLNYFSQTTGPIGIELTLVVLSMIFDIIRNSAWLLVSIMAYLIGLKFKYLRIPHLKRVKREKNVQ